METRIRVFYSNETITETPLTLAGLWTQIVCIVQDLRYGVFPRRASIEQVKLKRPL